MNILSIGSDERVFEKGSVARSRQEVYAKTLGHVDLVVLSKRLYEPHQSEALSLLHAYASSPIARLRRARAVALGLPKPDVVTVQDPFEIGFVGWLVARHFNVPLHVQVHTDFLTSEYARHSLVNRIRTRIANFVLKRAAGIRVVSAQIKTLIEKRNHLHAPITVLPIFVDIEKFKNAKASPELAAKFERFKLKLLVVARLESEKNIELAIRSFAEAAPEDACLIIVGEGSMGERLKALARAFSASNRIFFEGAQDPAPYYALADLVLVTSNYEGYGLIIIEALGAGKPVLSTDIGVAREAGAIISNEKDFTADLRAWFADGPREGVLQNYPYKNFDDYVRAYCEDITACAKK